MLKKPRSVTISWAMITRSAAPPRYSGLGWGAQWMAPATGLIEASS
jgi:hypothetical protein